VPSLKSKTKISIYLFIVIYYELYYSKFNLCNIETEDYYILIPAGSSLILLKTFIIFGWLSGLDQVSRVPVYQVMPCTLDITIDGLLCVPLIWETSLDHQKLWCRQYKKCVKPPKFQTCQTAILSQKQRHSSPHTKAGLLHK
jgi:hypothetical protein